MKFLVGKCSKCVFCKLTGDSEPCLSCLQNSENKFFLDKTKFNLIDGYLVLNTVNENRTCGTCHYEDFTGYNEPCKSCYKDSTRPQWTPKKPLNTLTQQPKNRDCFSCRHIHVSIDAEPCLSCHAYSNWEKRLFTESAVCPHNKKCVHSGDLDACRLCRFNPVNKDKLDFFELAPLGE